MGGSIVTASLLPPNGSGIVGRTPCVEGARASFEIVLVLGRQGYMLTIVLSTKESGAVMRAWILCLSLGLLSAGVQAECNLEKAAKNEALNATLGVKGRCDTDKLVRQQQEKAGAEVKKHTTDVLEQKSAGIKEGKSQLQGTQQKVNQAGQQLKQTQQDVKAVAKDPLKAAATAVINQG